MKSENEYFMYLRKSRADREAELHGEGETLSRHKKILLAFAQKNNLHVTQIYKEVVSGETISERPEIQNMLAEIEKGYCTGVIVIEVERLARGDTKDQGIIAETFKYSNTKIITPTKTYDPNNEFDEEYFEFGLFMSRREYKTINRRIQNGRIASAKEGKFLGSVAPYGYRKVKIKNDKGYTLEPDPNTADVVRMIFQWSKNGVLQGNGTYRHSGSSSIARKLDSMHIAPPKGDYWSRETIADILRNPVYMGKIRWSNKKTVRVIKNGTIKKVEIKNDNPIYVDGLHEPLITEPLFEAVQKQRSKNRKTPLQINASLKNPLSGFVYCGKCGHLMTRLGSNSHTPYDALICPNKYCDNISSPLYLVEEKLILFLNEWIKAYTLNWDLCEQDIFPVDEEIQLKKKALTTASQKLKDLRDQRNNVYTLLEKGIYTIDVFNERSRVLKEQICLMEKDIQFLNDDYKSTQTAQESKEIFLPSVKNIVSTYWSVKDIKIKNDMLRSILIKVVYHKNTPNKKGQRNNPAFTLDIYPKIPKAESLMS